MDFGGFAGIISCGSVSTYDGIEIQFRLCEVPLRTRFFTVPAMGLFLVQMSSGDDVELAASGLNAAAKIDRCPLS
ncbi:hypothetical protein CO652_13590 [Rhizobium sp. H4]|nr:hypothetical protein CO652_13590 [Rhizobium sp. H4]